MRYHSDRDNHRLTRNQSFMLALMLLFFFFSEKEQAVRLCMNRSFLNREVFQLSLKPADVKAPRWVIEYD